MIPRYACDCDACRRRDEDTWDRFVSGHQEVADHLRDVFLNPESVTPVQRLQQYLVTARESGATRWEGPA
jgi:hypothetical protein